MIPLIRSPDDFLNFTDVSRETLARLERYAELLRAWQHRINLIGPKTVDSLWHRHFFDSAQLAPLIPASARRLIDLGSGAGFPGLVLCIMTSLDVHLVESDSRKTAFLREAARVAGVSDRLTVHAARSESVSLPPADIVTARALAPLTDLLGLAERFSHNGTIALFPKGKRYQEELTKANYVWYINSTTVASRSDPNGVVLVVSEIQRRPG